MKRKIGLAFAIITGSVIGTFRGEVAKQKYVAKVKSRYEHHNKMHQQEEVVLDEFELAAFHTS